MIMVSCMYSTQLQLIYKCIYHYRSSIFYINFALGRFERYAAVAWFPHIQVVFNVNYCLNDNSCVVN